MFDKVVCTHVEFVDFGFDEVVPEDGHVFLWVELVLAGVFGGGDEDQGLVGGLELLNPVPASENAFLELVDTVVLLFGFLDVFGGNGDKGLGQGVEVEQHLVPRLLAVDVVCR
jgi:hypothetical protein